MLAPDVLAWLGAPCLPVQHQAQALQQPRPWASKEGAAGHVVTFFSLSWAAVVTLVKA